MQPQLAASAVRRGVVFTRGDAIAAGYSPGEIRARIRSGRWTVLRRGVYVHGASDEALARLAAVLCGLPETAALSHRSAAMLLGLPLVGVRPGPVEVTVPGAVPPSRVRQQRVESSGARCPAGDAAPPYPLA